MNRSKRTSPCPLFPLGKVVATPGALEAMARSGNSIHDLLKRHVAGDWGDVCDADTRLNDEAIHNGGRLLSSYRLTNGAKLWVLTEADRSATTALLPEEY
jgi:hypothetical protein